MESLTLFKQRLEHTYRIALIIVEEMFGKVNNNYMWEGYPYDNETILFDNDNDPYIKLLGNMSPEALKLLETHLIDVDSVFILECDSKARVMRLYVYDDV